MPTKNVRLVTDVLQNLTPPESGVFDSPYSCIRINALWRGIFSALVQRLDDPTLWDFDEYDPTEFAEWIAFRDANIYTMLEQLVLGECGEPDDMEIYADDCVLYRRDGDTITEIVDLRKCGLAGSSEAINASIGGGGGTPVGADGADTSPDKFNPVDLSPYSEDQFCSAAVRAVDYIEGRLDSFLTQLGLAEDAVDFANTLIPADAAQYFAQASRIETIASEAISLGVGIIQAAKTPENRQEAICAFYCTLTQASTSGIFGTGEMQQAVDRMSDAGLYYNQAAILLNPVFNDGLGGIFSLGGVIPRNRVINAIKVGLNGADDVNCVECSCAPQSYSVQYLAGYPDPDVLVKTEYIEMNEGEKVGSPVTNIRRTDIPDDETFNTIDFLIKFDQPRRVTRIGIVSQADGTANQTFEFDLYLDGQKQGTSGQTSSESNTQFVNARSDKPSASTARIVARCWANVSMPAWTHNVKGFWIEGAGLSPQIQS